MEKVRIKQIIQAVEEFAPLELARDWDNIGLMVGNTGGTVENVLLCLDVTPDIIEEAEQLDCKMIISHHPYIFRGLKNIDLDCAKGNGIKRIIKNDMTVYSAHTNLDDAEFGINYYLMKIIADIIDEKSMTVKEFAAVLKDRLNAACIKIIYGRNDVYENCDSADKVIIGDKISGDNNRPVLRTMPESCRSISRPALSSSSPGVSTLSSSSLQDAKYPRQDYDHRFRDRSNKNNNDSSGVNNDLVTGAMSACGAFEGNFQAVVDACAGDLGKVFVVGEIKYNDALDLTQEGITIIEAGHYDTEKIILPYLKDYLSDKFNNVKFIITKEGYNVEIIK